MPELALASLSGAPASEDAGVTESTRRGSRTRNRLCRKPEEHGHRAACLHHDGVAASGTNAGRSIRRTPVVAASIDRERLIRSNAQAGVRIPDDVVESYRRGNRWEQETQPCADP